MLNHLDRRTPALLLCGFRPFFLLAALSAALAMTAWGLFLAGHVELPTLAGGPLAWHGHEMVFGFGLAAVTGFALTAVPEFTASQPVKPGTTAMLAMLWVIARAGFIVGDTAGAWLAAIAEAALMGGLLACLAPRLWNDPGRAHLSFLWALLALLATVIGYHLEALAGQGSTRWLHAATGVLMVLLILAMSRISMRIVNAALEARGDSETPYHARPPRRNLATFCIALHSALEFLELGSAVSGWVALAAAAALLNLTNDWHVGRALFSRWVLMAYVVYWLMALGYGLIGLALLADLGTLSGGRHVLAIGAMGLGILVVMSIAGRVHAGLAPDERAWVPIVALGLVTAALVRATSGWLSPPLALPLAASLWVACFATYFVMVWPIMSKPRKDGRSACAGIAE